MPVTKRQLENAKAVIALHRKEQWVKKCETFKVLFAKRTGTQAVEGALFKLNYDRWARRHHRGYRTVGDDQNDSGLMQYKIDRVLADCVIASPTNRMSHHMMWHLKIESQDLRTASIWKE